MRRGLKERTRAVLQFLCGILSAVRCGFFFRKEPRSGCGFALEPLENRFKAGGQAGPA